MATNQTDISAFSRKLSELKSTRNFLDPNSYIEISQDSTSYKVKFGALDSKLIGSFDIYNNLDKIFNPLKHINDTYFETNTTFYHNPFIHEENNVATGNNTLLFDSLQDQNLITKKAIEEYLDENGICVPINAPGSEYVYYSSNEQMWVRNNKKIPMVMDYQKDGIWTGESKVKFNYGTNFYYFTDEITTPKNIMLNVTGNIVLSDEFSDNWYENQNFFVGLTLNGKLVTLTFLKNILLIEDPLNKGKNFKIAQFHFSCPLAKNAKFRVITNASCRLFGVPTNDIYSRKLYDSLNTVNLSYYDYGSIVGGNTTTEESVNPQLNLNPDTLIFNITSRNDSVLPKYFYAKIINNIDSSGREIPFESLTFKKRVPDEIFIFEEITIKPFYGPETFTVKINPTKIANDVNTYTNFIDVINKDGVLEGYVNLIVNITNDSEGGSGGDDPAPENPDPVDPDPVEPEPELPPIVDNRKGWIVPAAITCESNAYNVSNDLTNYVDYIEPVYDTYNPLTLIGFVLIGHEYLYPGSTSEINMITYSQKYITYNGKRYCITIDSYKSYDNLNDRNFVWNNPTWRAIIKRQCQWFGGDTIGVGGQNDCMSEYSFTINDYGEWRPVHYLSDGGGFNSWINCLANFNNNAGFGESHVDRRIKMTIDFTAVKARETFQSIKVQLRDWNNNDAFVFSEPIVCSHDDNLPLVRTLEIEVPACTNYIIYIYVTNNQAPLFNDSDPSPVGLRFNLQILSGRVGSYDAVEDECIHTENNADEYDSVPSNSRELESYRSANLNERDCSYLKYISDMKNELDGSDEL